MTGSPLTVRTALAAARHRGLASIDAQRMLASLLGLTRTGVIAHDDLALDDSACERWRSWLDRRADGEPLAYLLGEKEFRGLRLAVTPDVLVPRPESELLVDWVIEIATTAVAPASERVSIVDLGTGSGAIAIAIGAACSGVDLTATDVSLAALAVARGNAARHGVDVRFVESSWWTGLGDGRFDVVVANPPYVAADHPALADLRHEPVGALVSGADGLDALRELVAGATGHLRPAAWLLLEHGADQGEPVRALLAAAGFTNVSTRRDLDGLERATGGRAAAPAA